jgi:hypothetical protein
LAQLKFKEAAMFARLINLLITMLSLALFTPAQAGSANAEHAFAHTLRQLCNSALSGEIETNTPEDPTDPFVGKTIVMHVHTCKPKEIRIGLHVGDDRSRTWVIRKTATGLRLKHVHRHVDGGLDRLTNYGGDSRRIVAPQADQSQRVEFPADGESIALFTQENRLPSRENVWALEVSDQAFFYELKRPNRVFRLRFLRSATAPLPPASWGTR